MEMLELIIDDPDTSRGEMLVALLSQIGFDSFTEEENRLKAFIPVSQFDEEFTRAILSEWEFSRNLVFHVNKLPDVNWNEKWEKEYEPVLIASKVFVRAPFHEPLSGVLYDILIQPQMSFGTAHHETTSLMIEWMLEMELNGRAVLDMGCGTGILAILANKMKAGNVIAVDTDEWAYKNAISNTGLNGTDGIEVLHGDTSVIREKSFDVIMANINRNTLFEQIPVYRMMLKAKGDLLMSGFYRDDLEILEERCTEAGFSLEGVKMKNNWTAALFTTVHED